MMYFLSRFKVFLTLVFLAITLVVGSSLSSLHHVMAVSSSIQLKQLSSDPYTNSSSQHKTEVEPDTYSFGSTIVTAFQAGRFYSGGGSSNIGWATSTNSGTSWTNGFLNGITAYAGGTYKRASDPSVAHDAAHNTWLISSLAMSVVNNNVVGAAVLVSRSSDGGLTWGSPKSPQNQSFSALGGQPLVQPSGTVIVPIYGTDLTTGKDHIYAYTSTNGGASWNDPVVVSTVTYHIQQASYRGGSLPSAEIDQAGNVYVVWADCRFEANCSAGDIVMSTSTDGLTWSTVQRIPIDAVGSGVDHFTAGIAVDKSTVGATAHLALVYYYFANTNCTNTTCQLYAGFVSSVNGGASWSPNVQLAGPMSIKWLANTTDGYMTGDYISTSIVGNQAFPAIPVAFAPLQKKLQEFMYTAALNVVGGAVKVRRDAVLFAPRVQRSNAKYFTAN